MRRLRTELAQAIFLATRGKKHPANGGEHWHTADRMEPWVRQLVVSELLATAAFGERNFDYDCNWIRHRAEAIENGVGL